MTLDLGALLVGLVVLTAVVGAAGVAVGILLIAPAITRRMDRQDEAQEPGDRDG